MIEVIDMVLLVMMALAALAVLWLRNLFAVAMLSGAYSLMAATLYVVLDAVDVAFTEAAVGAGISTVLMLGTLSLVPHEERPSARNPLPGLAVVAVLGALLVYATLDMPRFGDPDAPIHRHVAPRYVNESLAEVGPTNIVTSVLASYRGYDTLGETTVIFAAAIGVLAMLGWSGGRRRKDGEEEGRR
jgi:multicomponent Na+:H+ antiporter subunit B